MLGIAIDNHSHLPKHHQVKIGLLAAIREGRLKIGDRLPPENELCESLGVSRMTLRQALGELEREGRILRETGRGTYVTRPPMPRRFWTMISFTEEIRSRGLEPTSRLLEARLEVPAEEVLRALQLPRGGQVFSVDRLRLASGEPVAINRSHVPAERCPGLLAEDLAEGSLYTIIQDLTGQRITRSDRSFMSVALDDREAALLAAQPGEPALLVTGTTYLESGLAIDYCVEVYRE